MVNQPQLLTKPEVAERLRCSERTLERQISSRKFPPGVRWAKEKYWDASVVDAWLAAKLQPQREWSAAPRKRGESVAMVR